MKKRQCVTPQIGFFQKNENIFYIAENEGFTASGFQFSVVRGVVVLVFQQENTPFGG